MRKYHSITTWTVIYSCRCILCSLFVGQTTYFESQEFLDLLKIRTGNLDIPDCKRSIFVPCLSLKMAQHVKADLVSCGGKGILQQMPRVTCQEAALLGGLPLLVYFLLIQLLPSSTLATWLYCGYCIAFAGVEEQNPITRVEQWLLRPLCRSRIMVTTSPVPEQNSS